MFRDGIKRVIAVSCYFILVIYWFSNSIIFAQKDANTATSRLAVLSEHLVAEDISEIQQLLEAGADANVKNTYDATPLYMASENGHSEVVKLLLAAGADVNIAENIFGTTPLIAAVTDGHAEIVKLLIAANADVNIATKTVGLTSLIIATQEGHADIVKQLIEAGANIDATMMDRNGDKYTALQISRRLGHVEIVKLLLSAGAKETLDVSGGLGDNGNSSAAAVQRNSKEEATNPAKTEFNKLYVDAGMGDRVLIVPKGIIPPVCLIKPIPPHTEQARNANTEGIVLLTCIVRKDGTVGNCRIEKGLGFGLDEAAINTVETDWRFKPGTIQGKTADLEFPIVIEFKMH